MSTKLEQHLSQRGTYFCSVTHDLDLATKMVETLPDFLSWAYIIHEPDTDNSTKHYHFLVRCNGTRTVKQIGDKLGISGQYVQVCKKVVAFRRYMLHLDCEEKIKYSLEDLHCNCLPDFKSAIIGNDKKDINDIYSDWKRLRSGRLTAEEFLQQNYVEISKLPFYQKIKTFELIDKYCCTTATKTT